MTDWYRFQQSRWNPILKVAARLTGCYFFWYLDESDGRRHLWFAR